MEKITAHIGGIFRHVKTQGIYQVILFATIEATMTPAVVYQNLDDKKVWVRPIEEFEDGRFELARRMPDAVT